MAMAIALVATAPAALANPPFLPHHTPYTFPAGECTVTVQHGNYLGAAYAKINAEYGWCHHVYVQVVYSTGNGQIYNGPWEGASPPDDKWYQSTAHYSNIVGSNYYICPWTNECYFYQFSAI
ncbi:MAG TPA: hypothetical protein VE153_25055 [Myxococcus sp.]|jgi:hypothetical protein|nr:hypothetical protein [Myxococcus sp.]